MQRLMELLHLGDILRIECEVFPDNDQTICEREHSICNKGRQRAAGLRTVVLMSLLSHRIGPYVDMCRVTISQVLTVHLALC